MKHKYRFKFTGHLLGLKHQKSTYEGANQYFHYGHGYKILRAKGKKEGTRTIMATAGSLYKKRLNLYSNPDKATGDSDDADNARVLRYILLLIIILF